MFFCEYCLAFMETPHQGFNTTAVVSNTQGSCLPANPLQAVLVLNKQGHTNDDPVSAAQTIHPWCACTPANPPSNGAFAPGMKYASLGNMVSNSAGYMSPLSSCPSPQGHTASILQDQTSNHRHAALDYAARTEAFAAASSPRPGTTTAGQTNNDQWEAPTTYNELVNKHFCSHKKSQGLNESLRVQKCGNLLPLDTGQPWN